MYIVVLFRVCCQSKHLALICLEIFESTLQNLLNTLIFFDDVSNQWHFIYFTVSREISVYLVKLTVTVISINSEMISYHFTSDLYFHSSLWVTSVFFIVSKVDDTSTSDFLMPLTSEFLNQTIKCWDAFS